MTEAETAAATFAELRPALVGAAYRILGSVADAEDVVQDAWLRWSDVDHDRIDQPRAYLIKTVSRLALNRIRQQRRRREAYVGPWLPEPLPDLRTAGADADLELAESVSMAMLVILQNLSPAERAAFVLYEVFGFSYPEIAAALDRNEPAARQLVSRARQHVRSREPRRRVDASEHRRVTDEFRHALARGSISELMQLLAPEAVLISDGGGVKKAALRPIHGADKIIRWFLAVMQNPELVGAHLELMIVNGEPAIAVITDRGIDSIGFGRIGADGRIGELYVIRNPEKLSRVWVS